MKRQKSNSRASLVGLQNFTYILNGGTDDWAALGNHHDVRYEHLNISHRHQFFWKDHPMGLSRHCHFDLVVYPSETFEQVYKTNRPMLFAGLVLAAFAATALSLVAIICIFTKKQQQVKAQADSAESVVASLFPQHVGAVLLAEAREKRAQERKASLDSTIPKLAHVDGTNHDESESNTAKKPIAELYPQATIMCT